MGFGKQTQSSRETRSDVAGETARKRCLLGVGFCSFFRLHERAMRGVCAWGSKVGDSKGDAVCVQCVRACACSEGLVYRLRSILPVLNVAASKGRIF